MPADAAVNGWRGLALLAIVLAVVVFVLPLAVPFPLLDPDEGLHAAIAQEMVERDHWITPTFLGKPFPDKPILYFWYQAASIALLGSSEASVRLPGLMCGLLGAVTTGLLAWRLFGRLTGVVAAILYTTTILPTAMAQAASHDVALAPWVNLAVLLLWESERPGSRAKRAAEVAASGLFVGLAVLTKGLTGVAAVGLAYGGYIVLTRRWQCFRREVAVDLVVRAAGALLIAALVAAPWYLAVERSSPGYLRYFLFERHVLGFATDTQPHGGQPWWYYLPILVGGGLPWIGYLGAARRRGQAADPRMTLLWCWLVGWMLFVTLARSKLATYLWPAFPPLAILAAVAWTRLIENRLDPTALRRFGRTFVGSSLSGPIVLPAVVAVVQWFASVRFGWPTWAVVGVAAALAPAPLIAWSTGRWRASLAGAAGSVALQFIVVITLLVPPVAENFSARDLAVHFNRLGRLPERLWIADERVGSIVFYLEPPLRTALKPDQFRYMPPDRPSKVEPGDLVAVPAKRLARASEFFDLDDRPYETVGRYRLYSIR
jgi:4-amino-4-deoxy-L-arabinose transferase-like glycosyltransferase